MKSMIDTGDPQKYEEERVIVSWNIGKIGLLLQHLTSKTD